MILDESLIINVITKYILLLLISTFINTKYLHIHAQTTQLTPNFPSSF